jgi:molybdate transport system ATP-binding protein
MFDEFPYITFQHVTLRAGDELVFHDTDWTLLNTQHWGIIGPNGAGKSLFAKAICRTLPVVRGRISYHFGTEPGEHSPLQPRSYLKRGEIVTISADIQKALLHMHGGYHQARWQSFEGQDAPTVAEVLSGAHIERISSYDISPLRTDEAVYRERRDQAVAMLEIKHLLARKILHISHGEGRKVLLARALMQRPRVLILDDPFCGLDTESRAHLLALIEEIIDLNTFRVLLIAPRREEIPENITHLLQIENRQVRVAGTRLEILRSSPKAAFALKSIGELPPLEPVEEPALPPSAPLIEMRNVSVTYGDVRVLQNITWTMQPGEHWAIIGANGAGKTTLLSLILADNPRAYANDIRLFGRRRGSGESIWGIKRHIGWVSPELQLYYQQRSYCLSVVESGFFDSIGLYRACSPSQASHARAWMQTLGIAHLIETPFQAISTGEQRLVLLARALVKSPRLLVLDEPYQGLDRQHRESFLSILDTLCEQTSLHLLYVTHYWREMPRSITNVLHLVNGQIYRNIPRGENFL